jgi:glycosyltransferase involved in cell wall biosynthesis
VLIVPSFNPTRRIDTKHYILCVSRASKEKGLDDFCKLKYSRKVMIGDGPYLEELKQKYPDVEFLGKKEGIELADGLQVPMHLSFLQRQTHLALSFWKV